MFTPSPDQHPRHSCATGVRPFLLLVLVGALALACVILLPFCNPIIMAVVLASLSYPVHVKIETRLGHRRTLAALTTLFLLTLVIVIPLLLLLLALLDQGVTLATLCKQWLTTGGLDRLKHLDALTTILAWLQDRLPFLDIAHLDIQPHLLSFTQHMSEWFVRYGASLLGNMAGVFMNFGIMLFLLFYFLRDGREMVRGLKHLSPLREDQENRIFEKIRAVARSVLFGSLITAFCQGLIGGIGLAIVGIPALFWGGMMAFASLIPVVGTALIWIPAVIWLLLLGHWPSAVFLGLWCAILVGSIDSFLRPFFMRGPGGLSPFYIFLAILGGVNVFGLAGLLYGPLIIGFAMVMLFIYEEEFHEVLVESHVGPATEAAPRDHAECATMSESPSVAIPSAGTTTSNEATLEHDPEHDPVTGQDSEA